MLNEACAVVFDLDGTLVDSSMDLHLSASYLRKLKGLPESTLQHTMAGIGRGAGHLVRNVLELDAEADLGDAVDLFRAYYNTHSTDHSVAYHGIKALLQDLRQAGIKTAIVTNKPHDSAQTVIERLQLPVDLLLGESEKHPAKPAPDMLLAALQELDVSPLRAVYVGDMSFDLRCARAAGCAFVGVDFGYLPKSLMAKHTALSVRSIEALRRVLWAVVPED